MNCCPNHALGHALAETITHIGTTNRKEQVIFSTTFVINSLLALVLLLGGFILNFSPMIGEGLHQIEDSLLIILGIIATTSIVQKKNDINYTLGKGQDNIIWTLVASVLLIAFEGNLFYQELASLTEKATSINSWSLVIIT